MSNFTDIVIDKTEVMRYLGAGGREADAVTAALIDKCVENMRNTLKPKYITREFDLIWRDGVPYLAECEVALVGETAAQRLCGCTKCALFAATLGIEADIFIRRAQSGDMAGAVIADACATDFIEKVCDSVQRDIAESADREGLMITDRFSPGYGDLPLELQTDICALLDTGRKIGLYLTDEFLLTPTKSVTALIGAGKPTGSGGRGCGSCNMRENCKFRKTGARCGV